MGDVQLPLRLSSSYYIAVSTSSSGELTSSPPSDAPLLTFPSPSLNFFKLPSSLRGERGRRTRPHSKSSLKKVALTWSWPFFTIIKPKGSDARRDNFSSSSSSAASQMSPTEESSPGASISPMSVLCKKLRAEEEGGSSSTGKCNEDGGGKMKWDPFDSPPGRLGPLLDQRIEYLDKESDSESDSSYGDPVASLRPSGFSDALKIVEGSSGSASEEINWKALESLAGHYGTLEMAFEATDPHPRPESKEIAASRGDLNDNYFVLKLLDRMSTSNSLTLFMDKLVRAVGHPRALFSMVLWLNLKKKVLLLGVPQLRAKMKKKKKKEEEEEEEKEEVAEDPSAGVADEEQSEMRFMKGMRCRDLKLEGSPYGDGGMPAAARPASPAEGLAEIPTDFDAEERFEGLEGRSYLNELMEEAAEYPAFEFSTAKDLRSSSQ